MIGQVEARQRQPRAIGLGIGKPGRGLGKAALGGQKGTAGHLAPNGQNR